MVVFEARFFFISFFAHRYELFCWLLNIQLKKRLVLQTKWWFTFIFSCCFSYKFEKCHVLVIIISNVIIDMVFFFFCIFFLPLMQTLIERGDPGEGEGMRIRESKRDIGHLCCMSKLISCLPFKLYYKLYVYCLNWNFDIFFTFPLKLWSVAC